jgi:hypothetical protein
MNLNVGLVEEGFFWVLEKQKHSMAQLPMSTNSQHHDLVINKSLPVNLTPPTHHFLPYACHDAIPTIGNLAIWSGPLSMWTWMWA